MISSMSRLQFKTCTDDWHTGGPAVFKGLNVAIKGLTSSEDSIFKSFRLKHVIFYFKLFIYCITVQL